MVLSLKAWKSRSPPGLPRTEHPHHDFDCEHRSACKKRPRGFPRGFFCFEAAWNCGNLRQGAKLRPSRITTVPLDHYISQVHLKNFYSPALDGMVYAIRKSDLKRFPTRSQDICRIEDNSTNAYLKNDRLVEEFLKDVEPRYNASLAKLRENKIDKECIHAIAGFAAFVITCSPAAMRLNSGPLKAMLNSTAQILDSAGRNFQSA